MSQGMLEASRGQRKKQNRFFPGDSRRQYIALGTSWLYPTLTRQASSLWNSKVEMCIFKPLYAGICYKSNRKLTHRDFINKSNEKDDLLPRDKKIRLKSPLLVLCRHLFALGLLGMAEDAGAVISWVFSNCGLQFCKDFPWNILPPPLPLNPNK